MRRAQGRLVFAMEPTWLKGLLVRRLPSSEALGRAYPLHTLAVKMPSMSVHVPMIRLSCWRGLTACQMLVRWNWIVVYVMCSRL